MEKLHDKENNDKTQSSSKKQASDMSYEKHIKGKSHSSESSYSSDSSDKVSSSEESRTSNKHKHKKRLRKHSSSRSRSNSRRKRHSYNRTEERRRDNRHDRKSRRHYSSKEDSDESSIEKRKRRDNRSYKKTYEKERGSYYESDRAKGNNYVKEYKNEFEGKSKAADDNQDEMNKKDTKPPIIKEKPNFNATGILARETNTVNGVLLKFTEPLDSAEPNEEWRLYCFKESETQDVIPIDQQSFYLIGKDERICNILVLHPSCSRQHAVMQFRKVDGLVKPYIMDLESTNGTFIDKEKLEPARYYELRSNDLINFGMSTRDYVIMKSDSDK